MNSQDRINEGNEELPTMPMEAGNIGDEQMPGGVKTDKEEWNYASDRVKKEPILPQWFRDFIAGL